MQESRLHQWSAVTTIHGRTWLYVLGSGNEKAKAGIRKALVGPLKLPKGSVTAHFAEAIFTSGMRTRVHSHPGPEAFFVVEGEQCMESPTDRKIIPAGGTYIVPDGPHLQAAPLGRRNLVLIIAPRGKPYVTPELNWQPTAFCNGPN